MLHPRLLDEAGDSVTAPVRLEVRDTPLRMRSDERHRRSGAVGAMVLQLGREVDVGDAVGVGQREGAIAEPIGRRRDAAAGRGVDAGIEAFDLDPGRQVRVGRELARSSRPGSRRAAGTG